MDTKMIKLTGLWKNETKNGEAFYSGSLCPGARLLLFKNGFKKGDRDPDLVLYIAPADRQERERTQTTSQGGEETPF